MATLALCVLGVVLGQWQNVERNKGVTDPMSNMVRAVVSPASAAVRRPVVGANDFWRGFTNSGKLTAENKALKQEALAMSGYERQNVLLTEQVDRLRKTVGLPNYGRKRVFADVIGFFDYDNRLTLGIGADKGITPGMPVISSSGLVGLIQTVDKKRSQVQLISSPTLKIGVMIEGSDAAVGLLRGENANRLIWEVIDENSPLKVGDYVCTSGYGEMIPRGIRVGRVVEIMKDPEYGATRVFVAPSVRFIGIQEVLVLK